MKMPQPSKGGLAAKRASKLTPLSGAGSSGQPSSPAPTPPANLDDKCTMTFSDGKQYEVRAEELIRIKELGRGGYGIVETMRHPASNTVMAVKRIHVTLNNEEQKRMLIELNASMKSGQCPYMVRFYGAMFREGDVWICMEVMDTSLDKFYRMCFDHGRLFTEPILSRLSYCVIAALHYMKEELKLMHRDVKPSNILINRKGEIKICDFGISGHLTDSVAKTINAGCKPYMAPERINPQDQAQQSYDIRSDVWSLGITLVEIATGTHPYAKWKTPFEQLKQVVVEPPPHLPPGRFSPEFDEFIEMCLKKEYRQRPKYAELLKKPFITKYMDVEVDVAAFVNGVLEESAAMNAEFSLSTVGATAGAGDGQLFPPQQLSAASPSSSNTTTPLTGSPSKESGLSVSSSAAPTSVDSPMQEGGGGLPVNSTSPSPSTEESGMSEGGVGTNAANRLAEPV